MRENNNINSGKRLFNVSEYCILTGLERLEVYQLIRKNKLQALKYKGIINIAI